MKEAGGRYKQSGVDIEAGDALVEKIKEIAGLTFTDGVLGGIGGFGGFYSLPAEGYEEPVLVASTDGVGTKLKIASMAGRYESIGIDLVAMCVNDILTHGAKPLFFLDYFATGKLELGMAEELLRGIAEGCVRGGCSLIGGETAEMPGVYPAGGFDLAGFAVGIVDRKKIVDGRGVQPGDLIAGLASSGLHSNGYSLARKVLLEEKGYSLDESPEPLECSLGEELLKPTVIYSKHLSGLQAIAVKGMVHVTGGGWFGNVKRILPAGCSAVFKKGSWEIPPVFDIIREEGGVSEEEMFSVFNMGIGFMLVIPPGDANRLPPYARVLGEVEEGEGLVRIAPEEGGRKKRGGGPARRKP